MKRKHAIRIGLLCCVVLTLILAGGIVWEQSQRVSLPVVGELVAEEKQSPQETNDPAGSSARPEVPAAAQAEVPATAQTEEARQTEQTAVYLGVSRYGESDVKKENKDNFRYRFETADGEKQFRLDNGAADAEGKYAYPLQNLLKEGYEYSLTLSEDTVTEVREIRTEKTTVEMPELPVRGTPGDRTLRSLLATAFEPMGTTLYVYGGGWDWQDEGSAIQTRTIGVSSDWVKFFREQDAGYTYKESDPTQSYYPYGGYNAYYYAGLDCSGYLGWVLYNTFETEDGKEGYVGSSTGFAKRLAERGWGLRTQKLSATGENGCYAVKPGDFMSINGHVWLSLGTCEDGSVLIAHSTPSYSRQNQPGGGVQLSALGESKQCEAYQLADCVMREYYPEWYERYEPALKDPASYFTFTGETAGLFSWDVQSAEGLSDPDGVQRMTPQEVLTCLGFDKFSLDGK